MFPEKLYSPLKNKTNLFVIFYTAIFVYLLSQFLLSGIYYFYQFNYSVSDVHIDYLAGLIGAFVITFIILIIPVRHKKIFLFAWLAKLFIVFVFDYLYEGRYYFLDAYGYYATSINDPVFTPKLFEGTHNIFVLTSYITTYIYPSYRLCVVFFAFVGIIAQYVFYRATVLLVDKDSKKLLILILFFPSMIFWSHILGKDPVVLFFIALYFLGFSYSYKGLLLKAAPLLVAAFAGFFFFRFWLAGIFGVSLALCFYLNRNIKGLTKLSAAILITVLCLFVIKAGLEEFRIMNTEQYFDLILTSAPQWSIGGSAQHIDLISFKTYLQSIPYLMFTSLFRPLFYEAENLFQLLAGIENTILLIYFFISLCYLLKYKLFKKLSILLILLNIIVWNIIYAPFSAQNLGTAVRYKLQIFPFILAFTYLTFHYRKLRAIYYTSAKLSKSRTKRFP